MCGRSSLTKTEKEIEARFNATFYSDELERYNPLPNFNVAPTQRLPVITSGDAKHIRIFKWGLIPSWAKDKNIGSKLINARVETLQEKTMFKSLLQSKRCIIPLDGFYEWKRSGKEKIPFRIKTTNQDIFACAGLHDSWIDPVSNELVETFTIITVGPNKLMEEIHNRMPAILGQSSEKVWLDPDIKTQDALQLLIPYPPEEMEAYQVSDKVNSVRINNKSLIEAYIPPSKPQQISLFD